MVLHIINLSHRKDRKDSAIREATTQNAEHKFMPGFFNDIPATGISHAHKFVVKFAMLRKMKCICIAEDDIKFTHPNAYSYFIHNIPCDFDLYLGSYYVGTEDGNHELTSFRGMTLYIIHERFYNTFISLVDNIDIDVALEGMGKFVVCPKFVAVQHPGYSDQRKMFCDDSEFVKDKVFYEGD